MTATVRCVFVLDPQQVVRAMIYYPLTNGEQMKSFAVDALQTHDEHNVATPANWHPGDKVIVKAPMT